MTKHPVALALVHNIVVCVMGSSAECANTFDHLRKPKDQAVLEPDLDKVRHRRARVAAAGETGYAGDNAAQSMQFCVLREQYSANQVDKEKHLLNDDRKNSECRVRGGVVNVTHVSKFRLCGP